MYSEGSKPQNSLQLVHQCISALTHFSSAKHKPYVPYFCELHKSYTIVQFLKCKIPERGSLIGASFKRFWKVSPRWRCLACHPLQFLLWCFLDSALLCLQSNTRYGHGSFSCQIEYFHNSTMIYLACLKSLMRIHAKSLPLCCPTLSIASTFCHLNKTGGLLLACLFYLQQCLLDCSRQTCPPGYGHQWLVLWNCYGGQWGDADQCDLANVIPGFCMCPILSMSCAWYSTSPPPNANCVFVRSSENSPHFDFLPLSSDILFNLLSSFLFHPKRACIVW